MDPQTKATQLPLAKDLTKDFPRSPREVLYGGYVIAARKLDKCRATLAGTGAPSLVVNFGSATVSFNFRAWSDQYEDWIQVAKQSYRRCR